MDGKDINSETNKSNKIVRATSDRYNKKITEIEKGFKKKYYAIGISGIVSGVVGYKLFIYVVKFLSIYY